MFNNSHSYERKKCQEIVAAVLGMMFIQLDNNVKGFWAKGLFFRNGTSPKI